jgi:serine protease
MTDQRPSLLAAGAVATIWRSCPSCDNKAVVSCLKQTAKDLGDPGKDVYYGYGLVQTEDAYLCLKNNKKCC